MPVQERAGVLPHGARRRLAHQDACALPQAPDRAGSGLMAGLDRRALHARPQLHRAGGCRLGLRRSDGCHCQCFQALDDATLIAHLRTGPQRAFEQLRCSRGIAFLGRKITKTALGVRNANLLAKGRKAVQAVEMASGRSRGRPAAAQSPPGCRPSTRSPHRESGFAGGGLLLGIFGRRRNRLEQAGHPRRWSRTSPCQRHRAGPDAAPGFPYGGRAHHRNRQAATTMPRLFNAPAIPSLSTSWRRNVKACW